MLCDRSSGRCIVTTSWDSEESMSASRDAVRAMRERTADTMGGQFEVQEWEIAVLHRAHQAPEGACCRVTWIWSPPRSPVASRICALMPIMNFPPITATVLRY